MTGNIQIETSGTYGGWELIDQPANKLPQDVASAVASLYIDRDEIVVPMYYHSRQIVNGMNHCLICKRYRKQDGITVVDHVRCVIYIPAGLKGYENSNLLKMEVADETILSPDAKKAFESVTKYLVGVNHKPLLEIGTQIVRGKNFHYIVESQIVKPNSEKYLTRFIINQFEGEYSLVSIETV